MTAPVDVLLMEDSEGDVLLVEEAVADFSPPVRLRVVDDGEQALRLLDDPTYGPPRLILMDVNTPRKGALEVLAELRQRPEWLAVPVVVYSSSSHPRDALRAYEAGANAYLAKPMMLTAFCELVQSTLQFWLSTVPVTERSVREAAPD
ncbi:response regulator [Deinococcus hopiensis]|uniref:Response regulator containing a CheY-like receiver domain and an HTH DNA-binding domain n=1 Tax=Deinococcus hopiensis KR-140 TaxID=695939 RepID=A0A1W1UP72_9DEIO|nr:response regulator [Deinococcus hopiensis]SMB82925.1 Response regulator containing a CheY-like receiver domain and an HTH DNA-binding domain [Deinococcus hopiensis KR-140]